MNRFYDVVCQGVYCLTISVPEDQDAHAAGCRALGLDEDDGSVEVFEVFE
jgi:hypothetical protein